MQGPACFQPPSPERSSADPRHPASPTRSSRRALRDAARNACASAFASATPCTVNARCGRKTSASAIFAIRSRCGGANSATARLEINLIEIRRVAQANQAAEQAERRRDDLRNQIHQRLDDHAADAELWIVHVAFDGQIDVDIAARILQQRNREPIRQIERVGRIRTFSPSSKSRRMILC